jgi:hypothetical protein
MADKSNEDLTVEEQLALIEAQMNALESMGDNTFIKPQCFAEDGCLDSPRGSSVDAKETDKKKEKSN